MRIFVALVVIFSSPVFVTRPARAGEEAPQCEWEASKMGCCPAQHDPSQVSTPVALQLGLVLAGLWNINERSGTWDADFYLYERWVPAVGFIPQTEIVNEVQRIATQFDTVEWTDAHCVRSRRIRTTVRSEYALRTFPFDREDLTLQLSDDDYDSRKIRYDGRPYTLGMLDSVRTCLPGWQVVSEPAFVRESVPFRWEPGAPAYEIGSFSIRVRRHFTYHLTKYFLPLFLIVAIAFAVFWVDPDDLNSQIAIGITCLLAAIALQFAEGTTLPEVAYLTFADRVYAICYFSIAFSIIESIYVNGLARRGCRAKGIRVDRCCRVAFPVTLLIATVLAAIRSATQTS